MYIDLIVLVGLIMYNNIKEAFAMTEHFKDRSFKRLTDTFPVPMLK